MPGNTKEITYPEEADDCVLAQIVLSLQSEQRVDEVLLGSTGLLAGEGVLLHDRTGEPVSEGAVLGERLFLQWEHPPEPRDVLRHGQGGSELEPVGHDGLELEALLVHHSFRVHEPLPER